jgi:hypothetical protein
MTRLYRHFDRDGVLLYVGISTNATWRQLAHQRSAGWWKSVRRIEISDPYPTPCRRLGG